MNKWNYDSQYYLFLKPKAYTTLVFVYLLAFLALVLSPSIKAQSLPLEESVPGGIVKLNLEVPYNKSMSKPEAYFKSNRTLVFEHNKQYYALVGLPLSIEPGKYSIKYKTANDTFRYKDFLVKSKKYKVSRIKIKNKNMVNPDSTTQTRIANDLKKISSAINNYSDSTPEKLLFKQPVRGIPTTSFGARRIINGQNKNPHSGMDIAAPTATPVVAAASGKVILADNFYLSGNMIALDHGSGLITMYAHLSEILVENGDIVKPGQTIGRVGNTGRVTGPHLHWTVKLNKTSVNPALFLEKINHNSKGFAGL